MDANKLKIFNEDVQTVTNNVSSLDLGPINIEPEPVLNPPEDVSVLNQFITPEERKFINQLPKESEKKPEKKSGWSWTNVIMYGGAAIAAMYGVNYLSKMNANNIHPQQSEFTL